ncbi:uncharacterized protein [Ptychodera flava]|uniref:uncharacterized protein n=1 Tax=Ptychodera flava TaxID=63121 RepID=UPI00396A316F
MQSLFKMAFARLASSSAPRTLLPCRISPITNSAPSFVRCSRLQCYSTAADHAAVQERNDVVKPFSEMPGKGSETLTGRLTYAFQGWRQRNTVKKPWDAYSEWNEKFGPVYKRVFGNTAMVYVSDPEDIAVVCRNEGKYPTRYASRLDMFQAWKVYKRQRNIPFGLMTTNGLAWFQGRTAFNKKMMRPVEVPKYGGVVNDVVTDLTEKIRRVRGTDNVVPDFQMLMYTWAVESISAILLNKRLHLLGETVPKEANDYINGILDVFDTSVLLFKFPASLQSALRTKPWRKHVKGWDAVFDYVIKRIDEKMDEVQSLEEKDELPSPENLDIVQHLILQSDLSTDMIYSQMTEVLMGAIDTTANTFQWAVYNLANNPEKQEKLREEVRRIVPKGEMVSYKHIEEIPYVTAVIKETLRVNPVIVNNSRVLDKDITIKGYNIPAGTPIVMLFHQSGRNSKYFEDPDQFKPERWLTRRSDKISSFTSIPFGFGPRMCIGKRFAMFELQVLLARMSQDFFWENSTTVEPKMSFLMMPDRPLNPKFIDRYVGFEPFSRARWRSRQGSPASLSVSYMAFVQTLATSRALSRSGLSEATLGRKLFIQGSPVLYYSSATSQIQQRRSREYEHIKPFSEVPGEGAESFWWRLTYAMNSWRRRKMPNRPWLMYSEWERKYGCVFKRIFGNTALVYLTDPEDFELVYRSEGKHPRRHSERYNLLHAWKLYKKQRNLPLGIFTTDDDEWHRNRAAFNKKMMRPMEMHRYEDVVNDVITDLIGKIRRVRQGDNIIPKFEFLACTWSVESIAAILFKKRLHSLDETVSEEANKFIHGVLDVFDTMVLLFKFPANVQSALGTEEWRRHSRAWDVIYDYGIKRIDEKSAEIKSLDEKGELPSPEKMDIIEHLLLRSDLSSDEIYSNISEVLLPSVDTTANALQWIVYKLAENPEKQEILRQEVRSVVQAGEKVPHESVKNLPYLNAVINETLRLYPVVTSNSRILDDDITIKGYIIPAGTPIVMLHNHTSRNPNYFEDPSEFKPERWLGSEKQKINKFTTMPFGFGKRQCLGKRIALLQLQIALCRIIQDFFIEGSNKVEPKMSFVMMPDRPLDPKFVDR